MQEAFEHEEKDAGNLIKFLLSKHRENLLNGKQNIETRLRLMTGRLPPRLENARLKKSSKQDLRYKEAMVVKMKKCLLKNEHRNLNSDLALPVHINSPGEPKFITFYQALESASIRNENLGVNVSQQQKLTGGVTKVDSNATVSNDISNDTANNNDTASLKSASIATTPFPDITTINITTTVQSANLSFASRLATEIIPDNRPKITSMAIQIPTNPGMSGQTTTAPIMKSFGTSASDNTMINTLASANISNTLVLLNVTTAEIVTIENVDVTSDTLPSTESTSDNVRPFESMDINIKTMEVTSPSTIKTITNVFTPASMNLQISTNISDTSSPITENVTITQILSEATTMSVMNNISENIETNTVQQYDETSSQTTETKDKIENIEINMIQQFDATIPSQMTENTSTIESTTEEIFNDITEVQVTQAPVTSTFHTPFIDISQNILSHLEDFTVRTSIEKPTTTTTSSKLFNIISDSSSINTKNLEETTTIWETSSRNVGITPIQDVDTELTRTMTNRSAQKMSTQNIVDLATAFSIAHNRSNDQNTNALNMPNSNMTQNARDSSINAEIATSSRLADFITKNDSRSSNDTLLTKLMTIAKTLFSEEINETRQSLLMPDQIYDFETIVPDINNLTQDNGMIENQLMLSNMLEKINASAELSTVLENTSKRIDVLTSRNETEENSNRGSTVGWEISLMELNTQSTDITNSIDVGDIITTPQISLFQINIETSNITKSISMSSELTTNVPDS
ncbi:uncharacterized protein [Polyergus mexicanus]|uniref:uncharacterized protein n=1 Tax=Polyergus mexicanus TaxID=615972 RepID=UPI0038B4E4A7